MVKVTALSIHTYARSWTFLLVGQGITKLMADPSLLTVLKRYPDPYAEFLPADVASKLTLKLAIQWYESNWRQWQTLSFYRHRRVSSSTTSSWPPGWLEHWSWSANIDTPFSWSSRQFLELCPHWPHLVRFTMLMMHPAGYCALSTECINSSILFLCFPRSFAHGSIISSLWRFGWSMAIHTITCIVMVPRCE